MDNKKEVSFYQYCSNCLNWHSDENSMPCRYCLLNFFNTNTYKPVYYRGAFTSPSIRGDPTNIVPMKDYLYYVEYAELDYEYAADHYLKSNDIPVIGGCSSVRNGQWYGRNLDWIYDENAEFVVHTPRLGKRYSSIGVSGGFNMLTDEFVKSKKYDPVYKLIPFQLYDGINEFGVVANLNVVPLERDISNDANKMNNGKENISGITLVRYILDNFQSASEAVNYIRDHVNIIFTKGIHAFGYELHYMIADKDKTYAIEVSENGEVIVIDITAKPFMTNFYLNGVVFNPDGSVYTPETQDDEHNAIITNHISPNGSGLERYNLINEVYSLVNDRSDMQFLMNLLRYTRAYRSSPYPSNPYWYTEFVGSKGLTCGDPASLYEEKGVIDTADSYYANRSRTDGGKTWQTVHSAVYDIYRKKLYLKTQEEDAEIMFNL